MESYLGALPHVGGAPITTDLSRRITLTKGSAPTPQPAERQTATSLGVVGG